MDLILSQGLKEYPLLLEDMKLILLISSKKDKSKQMPRRLLLNKCIENVTHVMCSNINLDSSFTVYPTMQRLMLRYPKAAFLLHTQLVNGIIILLDIHATDLLAAVEKLLEAINTYLGSTRPPLLDDSSSSSGSSAITLLRVKRMLSSMKRPLPQPQPQPPSRPQRSPSASTSTQNRNPISSPQSLPMRSASTSPPRKRHKKKHTLVPPLNEDDLSSSIDSLDDFNLTKEKMHTVSPGSITLVQEDSMSYVHDELQNLRDLVADFFERHGNLDNVANKAVVVTKPTESRRHTVLSRGTPRRGSKARGATGGFFKVPHSTPLELSSKKISLDSGARREDYEYVPIAPVYPLSSREQNLDANDTHNVNKLLCTRSSTANEDVRIQNNQNNSLSTESSGDTIPYVKTSNIQSLDTGLNTNTRRGTAQTAPRSPSLNLDASDNQNNSLSSENSDDTIPYVKTSDIQSLDTGLNTSTPPQTAPGSASLNLDSSDTHSADTLLYTRSSTTIEDSRIKKKSLSTESSDDTILYVKTSHIQSLDTGLNTSDTAQTEPGSASLNLDASDTHSADTLLLYTRSFTNNDESRIQTNSLSTESSDDTIPYVKTSHIQSLDTGLNTSGTGQTAPGSASLNLDASDNQNNSLSSENSDDTIPYVKTSDIQSLDNVLNTNTSSVTAQTAPRSPRSRTSQEFEVSSKHYDDTLLNNTDSRTSCIQSDQDETMTKEKMHTVSPGSITLVQEDSMSYVHDELQNLRDLVADFFERHGNLDNVANKAVVVTKPTENRRHTVLSRGTPRRVSKARGATGGFFKVPHSTPLELSSKKISLDSGARREDYDSLEYVPISPVYPLSSREQNLDANDTHNVNKLLCTRSSTTNEDVRIQNNQNNSLSTESSGDTIPYVKTSNIQSLDTGLNTNTRRGTAQTAPRSPSLNLDASDNQNNSLSSENSDDTIPYVKTSDIQSLDTGLNTSTPPQTAPGSASLNLDSSDTHSADTLLYTRSSTTIEDSRIKKKSLSTESSDDTILYVKTSHIQSLDTGLNTSDTAQTEPGSASLNLDASDTHSADTLLLYTRSFTNNDESRIQTNSLSTESSDDTIPYVKTSHIHSLDTGLNTSGTGQTAPGSASLNLDASDNQNNSLSSENSDDTIPYVKTSDIQSLDNVLNTNTSSVTAQTAPRSPRSRTSQEFEVSSKHYDDTLLNNTDSRTSCIQSDQDETMAETQRLPSSADHQEETRSNTTVTLRPMDDPAVTSTLVQPETERPPSTSVFTQADIHWPSSCVDQQGASSSTTAALPAVRSMLTQADTQRPPCSVDDPNFIMVHLKSLPDPISIHQMQQIFDEEAGELRVLEKLRPRIPRPPLVGFGPPARRRRRTRNRRRVRRRVGANTMDQEAANVAVDADPPVDEEESVDSTDDDMDTNDNDETNTESIDEPMEIDQLSVDMVTGGQSISEADVLATFSNSEVKMRFSECCDPKVTSRRKAASFFNKLLVLGGKQKVKMWQGDPSGDPSLIFVQAVQDEKTVSDE